MSLNNGCVEIAFHLDDHDGPIIERLCRRTADVVSVRGSFGLEQRTTATSQYSAATKKEILHKCVQFFTAPCYAECDMATEVVCPSVSTQLNSTQVYLKIVAERLKEIQ